MGLLKEKEVKSDFIARILFDEQQLGSPKIRSYTVLAVWISFYSLFSSQYSWKAKILTLKLPQDSAPIKEAIQEALA